MRILANVPVLPSRDLDRSAAFYARLGYQPVRRYPDYLILACGDVELHLALTSVDPAANPAGAYLRVSGVDELARALGGRAAARPWGQVEFAVADPDGNLVRAGEPVPR
jgi:catechol 2,3-dioxygenase-like lactoylglutathione lyase family enzyme